MWMAKTAHLYNAALPLTADNLIAALEAVRPGAIHAVPYAIGLLAEKEHGINAMKRCEIVTAAGARTPDELGDRLVKAGVNFGVVFGTFVQFSLKSISPGKLIHSSTEAGLSGDTIRREKDDDSWNYLRIYANIRKHIYMKALGGNLFECVYLKGHPALSTSNSDDPSPGSWHSADVFTPHPTIPDIWKYVTRIDDRVTLLNGEKVLPLPIEGRLREDELIREAVVVGVDKAVPGLLIFRAKEGDHLSEDDYINVIWPSIADVNLRAEAFSHISREMIALFPSGMDYPQTDKRSIIRSRVYRKFDREIEKMYADVEQSHGRGLRLDTSALEEYLMTICRDKIGITLESIEVDFFAAGVDSLKQIQMRRLIQRDLELNGNQLSPNVVYDHGNVRRLARYLYAIRNGEQVRQNDDLMLMEQMIAEYSSFQAHNYSNGSLCGTYLQATSDTRTSGSNRGACHQIRAAANDTKNLISQGPTMPPSISIDSASKEQSVVRHTSPNLHTSL